MPHMNCPKDMKLNSCYTVNEKKNCIDFSFTLFFSFLFLPLSVNYSDFRAVSLEFMSGNPVIKRVVFKR